ncbi:MAG: norR 23 [Anaerosporomusa subterranea]|jgi:transcriptional regulator with PAS, ATPase and Fis domain|nr:norR 23 [Anaerosporomusa subterranea]
MTSILFLAPYHSMAELAASTARQLGANIYIEVAKDTEAKAAVAKHPDVGVIISRGGLAEEIKETAGAGVSTVEVTMSINDLLSIVSKLSGLGLRRIGIVSRANLFDGIIGDFNISGTDLFIRSCRDEQEIEKTVRFLHRQGIEAVIGCRAAYETAKCCGIVAEFLESSAVSIKKAMEEALRIVEATERDKLQTAQLKAIIDNIEEGVIAVDDSGEVRFYNHAARRICAPTGKGLSGEQISELLRYRNQEKIIPINGTSVIAKVIPLALSKNKGDVVTFQEVSSIQAVERKIRFSSYEKGLYAKFTFSDIIGQSDSMKKMIGKAKTFSQYDSNLLIYGETGTGKEVLAQSVHNNSPRSKGPFVSVNTASIPPSLLESELFGYVEGAFTGARKGGKLGLFELAHGGTIFLDEIGELSPEIQSRLLRVLQEKEIMRIADDRIIPIDVRVISATNRDLLELVREGKFRQDLFYRVHVLGVRVPPLRERTEDIPLIFEHYLTRFTKMAKMHKNKRFTLTPTAIKALDSYPWPGNIRQLRNVAEVMACNLSEGELIDQQQIMEVLGEQETRVDGGRSITIRETNDLKQMEAEIVQRLLARWGADEVCRRLNISKVTLWRKTKV